MLVFVSFPPAFSLGRLKSPRNMRKFLGDSLHTFSSVRKYAHGVTPASREWKCLLSIFRVSQFSLIPLPA